MASTGVLISEVRQCIYVIRGQHAMLDSDLARFYEISTKKLNQQVKRNLKYFPEDFRFRLTQPEFENLRSQFVTSSLNPEANSLKLKNNQSKLEVTNCDLKFEYGGRRHLPTMFTLAGTTMLASVLKSDKAIEINVMISRAFGESSKPLEQDHKFDLRFATIEKQNAQILNTLSQFVEQRILVNSIQNTEITHSKKPPNLIIERILETVARYYNIRLQDLIGTSRRKKIAHARQIAMYFLRVKLELSFREIGTHLSRKDHTTVLHAYRKIEEAIKTDESIRADLEAVQALSLE